LVAPGSATFRVWARSVRQRSVRQGSVRQRSSSTVRPVRPRWLTALG
jgi:hypothetical protein